MSAPRHSIAWFGAVCLLVLASPAAAQLQTTVVPTLPSLPADASPAQDDSPMVCRAPQQQTDSRLPGPKVCRTQRQWDDLHARGLDISADGRSTVETDKYRAAHRGSCNTSQDSCF
jgi:hypothetical protein